VRRVALILVAITAATAITSITSCRLATRRGPDTFARSFTDYPGHVDGVRLEDARVEVVAGHRYGVVRIRSVGLQRGGWDVLRQFLGDQISNAFEADPALEAVFIRAEHRRLPAQPGRRLSPRAGPRSPGADPEPLTAGRAPTPLRARGRTRERGHRARDIGRKIR
jgi:hypothetical protein